MIRLAWPVHPAKGYSIDLSCPVIVCDVCSELIDSAHPGLVVWSSAVPPLHVHKGRCDRLAEARHGHLLSTEIELWLDQLAHNYEHPLIGGELDLTTGEKVTIREVRGDDG